MERDATLHAFLAAGGFCRLRCGRVVGPLSYHAEDTGGWPWRAGRFAFVSDGRYATNAGEHPFDAVGPALEGDRLDDRDLLAIVREGFARRDVDGTRLVAHARIDRVATSILDVIESRAGAPSIGRRRLRAAVRDVVAAAYAGERRKGVSIESRVLHAIARIRSGLRLAVAWPPARPGMGGYLPLRPPAAPLPAAGAPAGGRIHA